MKRVNVIFIILCVFLAITQPVLAQSSTNDDVNVNLEVNSCNYNGICETATENFSSCSSDCALPTSSSSTSGSTGGYPNVLLTNVKIDASLDSAAVSWTSSVPSMAVVRWGTTADLSSGILRTVFLQKNHEINLNNLKPNTIYFLEIENIDPMSRVSRYSTSFKTFPLVDNLPPQNPLHFSVRLNEGKAFLKWQNPPDADFSFVRIMRNTSFESSPYSGTLIYEGSKTEAIDESILNNKKYFYTIFSRDQKGNYSYGSLAILNTSESSSSDSEIITPDTPIFDIDKTNKITILQNQKIIPNLNNSIIVDSDLETRISITAKEGLVPRFVTITYPQDASSDSFLFHFDADQNTYFATIPSLGTAGTYPIMIFANQDGEVVAIADRNLRVRFKSQGEKDHIIPFAVDPIVGGLFLIILTSGFIFWNKKYR